MLRTQGAASGSEQTEIIAQHSRIIPFTYRVWQWFHGKWEGVGKQLKKTSNHWSRPSQRIIITLSSPGAQPTNFRKPTCNSGSMLEAKIADLKICIKDIKAWGGGAMKVHIECGCEVSTCMLGGEEFNEAV